MLCNLWRVKQRRRFVVALNVPLLQSSGRVCVQHLAAAGAPEESLLWHEMESSRFTPNGVALDRSCGAALGVAFCRQARGIGKSDPGTRTVPLSDAVHAEKVAAKNLVQEAQDFLEIEDQQDTAEFRKVKKACGVR